MRKVDNGQGQKYVPWKLGEGEDASEGGGLPMVGAHAEALAL